MSLIRSCRVNLSMALVLWAGVLALLTPQSLVAQQPAATAQSRSAASEPVVVVSIGELTRTLNDIKYVMRAAGVPEYSGIMELMVNQYSQGLDTKRPSGVALYVSSEGPKPVAFLPLADRKKFMETIATIGKAEDLGDGLFAVSVGGQSVYAREKAGWLYVAQTEENLGALNADPATVTKGLADRYDIAIKVSVQSLPDELKQIVMAQIKSGYETSMAMQNAGKSPEEIAVAKAAGEQSIEQMERMFEETDQFVIGWAVDPATKKTYIDIGAQFVEGSKTAKQLAAQSKITTKFPAFQSTDTALSLRFSSVVLPEEFQQIRPMLDQALANGIQEMEKAAGGQAPEFAKKVLTDIFGVFVDTLKEGTLDGGAVVTLNDRFQLISGATVNNGAKLETSLKDLVSKLGNQPDAPKIQFNASNYKGVSFHKGSLKMPAGADPTAKKVLGEQVNFIVGTADKAIYFALGEASEAALKAILDKNATARLPETTPVDFHAKLKSILAFANNVQANPVITSMLQAIDSFGENDGVSVSSKIVTNGTLYRLTVEEGVLRAAGAASKSGRPGGGF